MKIQGCCNSPEKTTDIGKINEGGFSFSYYLTYCKNCGKLETSRTYIDDGDKDQCP